MYICPRPTAARCCDALHSARARTPTSDPAVQTQFVPAAATAHRSTPIQSPPVVKIFPNNPLINTGSGIKNNPNPRRRARCVTLGVDETDRIGPRRMTAFTLADCGAALLPGRALVSRHGKPYGDYFVGPPGGTADRQAPWQPRPGLAPRATA
jgi:hypothetical protein